MKFKYYALQLSLICVILFILQFLFAQYQLTKFLLLNKRAFTEPWRFITSIFLHGSLGHLLYNIFALSLFGSILEKYIGSKRFLAVFFITGVLANLVSVNFYDDSLGASGAIFGIIGTLIVVRPWIMVWAFGLPMPIFVAGIFWVAGDLIGLFVPSDIANIAHLSGIFFGALFGIFLRNNNYFIRSEKNIKIDESEIRAWENRYLG